MEVIDPTSETVSAQDPWVARAQARLGAVLRDKWRLDALLGIGGMACVYAGTHRNGMRAAVKVLHPELSANPDVRTRFLREGYVANSIGHPNVVQVLDDDVAEDGSMFLVTELLEGETLEDRRLRAGGRLPEEEVAAFADQLLDVLAAAHAKGVVHRDLKPENLYLTRDGSIKVLDFGIARLKEFHSGGRATKSGAAMGTPSYMPPEQARGLWEEVDGSSDLWAVGATLFCLLSGRSVHEGRTSNEVLLSAMMRAAPPLATVASDVSPSIAHVVDVALAFDKASRWADASAMQAALRRSSVPVAPMATLKLPDPPPGFPLPPIGSAQRLSTARPVALTVRPSSPGVAPTVITGASSRSWLIVAVAIGAVVVVGMACVVGVAVAWSRSALRHPAPVLALSTLVPPPEASATLPVAASPGAPVGSAPATSVAASASPAPSSPAPSSASASATAPARRPVAAPAPPRKAPAAASECTPPYVVDPGTGKKKWKEECL
jgi:eukaryotic-like serine/threonine-protein kinase